MIKTLMRVPSNSGARARHTMGSVRFAGDSNDFNADAGFDDSKAHV